MRKLPLAYSCDRRWAEMQGGGTVVRRCGDCGCDVVNLSALDEETAHALLEQRRGVACVRYRVERGQIVFAKVRRAVAMAAAAAVLLTAAAAGADTSIPNPPPRRRSSGPVKKSPPLHTPKKPKVDEYDGKIDPHF